MSVLHLADYRRRVFALYAAVRARLDDDAQGAHAHWRDVRDELFAGHPESALDAAQRADFTGLRYWPYDPAWAFSAPLETDVPRERYVLEAGVTFVRVGAVTLPVGPLDVFWLDTYGGGLFVPFRDATAGAATYGGGRYLLDTAKGADLGARGGRLVLDFNFAYHPSCAYNAAWTCPLAPPGNRLDVAVEAGEQRP
jgi:uncharacterized protein (DUF1684 family)